MTSTERFILIGCLLQASPPKPKLTPEKVEVMEGTSVSLSCSAAAPCPKLPPNLTWTPSLSDSVDQLQENEDQTKFVSSVLTFTASHLHHGQKITCRALYKLQQGDIQKTSNTSLTLRVLYMPQISGSGSCSRTAAEISCSCESRGNPSPSMEWRVSGLRVTNSTDRVISEEQLGNTGLRSSLTMRHSQGDTPTLLCLSTNTLGSSSLRLLITSPQQHWVLLRFSYISLSLHLPDNRDMTGTEKLILIGCLLQGALSSKVSDTEKTSPPKPKLIPEKVEVMEGTSVNLSCSAAAPCPKLPPNLTWTPRLSDSVDQLQENDDQTKSVSSVLTFTASHLHHGQKITCRVLYKLQQGDIQKTSTTSLTLRVLYMPQISGSGSCSRTAAEISCSCESRGNPSPSMEWRVSGLRVTNSTDRVISEEQLGNTGLRSSLTMRHSQGDTPTLFCLSTNTLGSSSLRLLVPSPQQHSGEDIYANLMVARKRKEGEERGETEAGGQNQTKTQSQAADDTLHYASVKFIKRKSNPEAAAVTNPVYDNASCDMNRKDCSSNECDPSPAGAATE
ncbi:hypothetical protein SKAU_G00418770 [Synaphobranchus kaupii]|uniref:Ig-like domain-containing protein n=1 Tax=Synaphobranchus kaupii TaxID=118154 RepID=A0A9Q1E679_SYNKA|nr:hypothetical protein SKAU_G00418770 [Synaphobranchus kaupii]